MNKKKEKSCFMEEMYCKHERLMYYIAGKYAENVAEREDIVQATVLSLLRNETTLRKLSPCALANYISAAVRNTAFNTLKRNQQESEQCIPLDDFFEDFPQAYLLSTEVAYLEKERRKELLSAFQSMPEIEQLLLFGKYSMDMSDFELAQIVGCKPSSVRMKLTRARRIFIEKIREGGGDNE